MDYIWLLLVLPVAATFSWYAGKRSAQNSLPRQNDQFARDYFIGLNFLLNEQPDKAVDVFTRWLKSIVKPLKLILLWVIYFVVVVK